MAVNIQTKQEKKKTEIKMPAEYKKSLKDLYLLRSYSGFEEPVRRYIQVFLEKLKIPYINYNGNILGFNHPGAPLFSAHMDMVNTERYKLKNQEYLVNPYLFTIDADTNIRLYRDKEQKVQTSLGADDKNGIWLILNLLKDEQKINFAFCHSEEIGGHGSKQIIEDEELATFIEGCRYGIIVDRRNAGDIIGYNNEYCLALDDRLEAFSKEKGFNFKTTTGSVSDANQFSQLIECVNISCGYYEAHSSREYTNLNELWDTYLFCEAMLDDFNYHSVSPQRMRTFKKITKPPYKKEETTYYKSTYSTNTLWYKKEEDEKKITQKEKETTLKGTPIGETNTRIGIDEKQWMMTEAVTYGGYYDDELAAYVLPLKRRDEVADTNIVQQDICAGCGESVVISQDIVDSLYMNVYYNEKVDKVLGICTTCGYITDITQNIKKLI